MANSGALVDSYSSAKGPYGGSNIGSNGNVAAGGTITNNGGTINGQQTPNMPSDLPMPAIPSNAVNLPIGSSEPGAVYIDSSANSITLTPGSYVVQYLSVSYPGAIDISPAGSVTIFVTGGLNLGGNENLNGLPANLVFVVTQTGWVNVNSNGQLFGAIYAPTSGVNLNSAVFGYVVGSSVTLNSGAAVHFDTNEMCEPSVTAPTQLPPPPNVRGCYVGTWNGWASVPCTPFEQLPLGIQQKPYMGGGQVVIPGYLAGPATSIGPFGPIPGIMSSSGLKFGQVESTFVDVVSGQSTEVNTLIQSGAFIDQCNYSTANYTLSPTPTPNAISVQANTNNFYAVTGDAAQNGDKAWVQFAIQSLGTEEIYTYKPGTPWAGQVVKSEPGFAVCIWNNDFTLGKAADDYIPNASATACGSGLPPCEIGRSCQGGQCLAPTYWAECLASTNYSVTSSAFNLALQQRQFQALDHATVAGSAFPDKDGQDDLGMVAAMSWFDPSSNNNDYRGLYAVVTKDRYGLGKNSNPSAGQSPNWTTVSGTVLGMGGCATATFPQGTMVHTSVQAGNCAKQGTPPPGVPITVTWPGVCPNTLQISDSPEPIESTLSLTDESNNLNIVAGSQSGLANSTDGNNYLEMHYLASVDGNCVTAPRVYVKDHAQDHGSTPSNLGGEAFWESPDIIIVPSGVAVTANTPAGDPTVISDKQYEIYVRVHNDYACSPISGVRARVWWGDATLATTKWTDIITSGSDPSNPNWSAPKTLSLGDNLDLIGPIAWKAPSGVSPHQCLLVNIQANGESAPTNISDAPKSYQVAQRNIEIGSACGWTLANGKKDSQVALLLTTTDSGGQSYLVGTNDSVTVTVDDANQNLFNAWSGNPHPGCNISQPSSGKTMLTMITGMGQASVKGATLPANASIMVASSVIPALYSGTTIDLRIATYLSNGGSISGSNGSTCSATAEAGEPPIQ
jgi:hypothetical protein